MAISKLTQISECQQFSKALVTFSASDITQISVQRQVLNHTQIFIKTKFLGHITDMLMQLITLREGIEAIDLILPEVGCKSPASSLRKVVLPAPSGPTRPVIVPRAMLV